MTDKRTQPNYAVSLVLKYKKNKSWKYKIELDMTFDIYQKVQSLSIIQSST